MRGSIDGQNKFIVAHQYEKWRTHGKGKGKGKAGKGDPEDDGHFFGKGKGVVDNPGSVRLKLCIR